MVAEAAAAGEGVFEGIGGALRRLSGGKSVFLFRINIGGARAMWTGPVKI